MTALARLRRHPLARGRAPPLRRLPGSRSSLHTRVRAGRRRVSTLLRRVGLQRADAGRGGPPASRVPRCMREERAAWLITRPGAGSPGPPARSTGPLDARRPRRGADPLARPTRATWPSTPPATSASRCWCGPGCPSLPPQPLAGRGDRGPGRGRRWPPRSRSSRSSRSASRRRADGGDQPRLPDRGPRAAGRRGRGLRPLRAGDPGRAWKLIGPGLALMAVADGVYLLQAAEGHLRRGRAARRPLARLRRCWWASPPGRQPARLAPPGFDLSGRAGARPAACGMLAIGLAGHGPDEGSARRDGAQPGHPLPGHRADGLGLPRQPAGDALTAAGRR